MLFPSPLGSRHEGERNRMRKLAVFPALAAVTLAACSQQSDERATQEEYAPPGVSPTAAPGVAFKYGYDYSLEDGRISQVQEAHAGACEKLGVTKCRITGLDYQISDRDRVTAMLTVKLEPSIARQFGKQATAIVESSDGKLVRAAFSGEDVGTQIGTNQDRQADLQSRITDIERRLQSLRAGDREATQLQAQLEELRGQLAGARAEIKEGQQQLASTPMTFNYYGEGGIAGFDENPIKASWQLMIESAVMMISIVLKVFGALLPWALLLALILLLWRSPPTRAARRWWNRVAASPEDES